MDLAERRAMARRHPWELARSDHFRQLIREATAGHRVEALLDIGAGDGWFAHELIDDLPTSAALTWWDINYTSDDLNAALPTRAGATADGLLVVDIDRTPSEPADGSRWWGPCWPCC